jgi:hypothetical protein
MAATTFKAPPQFGQRSISMAKTRLSRRAQLMRRQPMRRSVIGRVLGCILRWARNDRATQRWLAPPLAGFTTILLLPAALSLG